jgi:acyl-CoA synthetase (AMP-forming)/AMP-acid ligase II
MVMTGYPSRHGTVEVDAVSITEKLFEGLAGREDEVAITDGATGRALTAGALMGQIKRLAGGLTERGVLPGGTVAILAPNLPEYPVVFHGVAWGGGTVTTINPTYTAPEIHHQLVDAGAVMLVTVPPSWTPRGRPPRARACATSSSSVQRPACRSTM